MTLIEFLILLLVAGVCGALGQAMAGFSRGGCLAAVALGFIGALVGRWIAEAAGLSKILAVQVGDVRFPIVWSIGGSALFVAVLGFLSRASRGDR